MMGEVTRFVATPLAFYPATPSNRPNADHETDDFRQKRSGGSLQERIALVCSRAWSGSAL